MTVKKLLGFAAIGGLLILAAPVDRAQALSLLNPGAAAAVQAGDTASAATEVRWRRGGWGGHRRYYRRWRRW